MTIADDHKLLALIEALDRDADKMIEGLKLLHQHAHNTSAILREAADYLATLRSERNAAPE